MNFDPVFDRFKQELNDLVEKARAADVPLIAETLRARANDISPDPSVDAIFERLRENVHRLDTGVLRSVLSACDPRPSPHGKALMEEVMRRNASRT